MNLKPVISSVALFSLALVITIFNVASASEQAVATIASDSADRASFLYKLIIDTTQDERAIKTFYKDVYQGNKRILREAISPSALVKGDMVLEKKDKFIILRLRSSNFDVEQGGVITIDTLYNGIKGERKGYDIQLAKSRNGWALTNKSKEVSQILLQTNRVAIIGDVGIKNVVMK